MFNKQQRGYIIIKQHKKAYFWIINEAINVRAPGVGVKERVGLIIGDFVGNAEN